MQRLNLVTCHHTRHYIPNGRRRSHVAAAGDVAGGEVAIFLSSV